MNCHSLESKLACNAPACQPTAAWAPEATTSPFYVYSSLLFTITSCVLWCAGLCHAVQESQQESQASLIQQLKSSCSGMAAVLPFASTTVIKASSSGQAEIYYGLAKAVDVSIGLG